MLSSIAATFHACWSSGVAVGRKMYQSTPITTTARPARMAAFFGLLHPFLDRLAADANVLEVDLDGLLARAAAAA